MKTNGWHTKSAAILYPRREELRKLVAEGKHQEARRIVHDLYPFGERKYWPYKEWLIVVKAVVPGLYPSRKPTPEGWVEKAGEPCYKCGHVQPLPAAPKEEP